MSPPRADLLDQRLQRLRASPHLATQLDIGLDILARPLIVQGLQLAEAALLRRVVGGQSTQLREVLLEAALALGQRPEERLAPGDDETAHAGLDVDQAGQQRGRLAEHIVAMDIALDGADDLAETAPGGQHQNQEDQQDDAETRIQLLGNAEIGKHGDL